MKKILAKSYLLTSLSRVLRRVSKARRWHRIKHRYAIEHIPASNPSDNALRAFKLLERVERECPWLPNDLYPAAAGSSGALLTYLLVRALKELRIESTLELGAGQSTRILSSHASTFGSQSLTFEEDRWWAEQLVENISHGRSTITVSPVVSSRCEGKTTRFYDDYSRIIGGRRFSLFLVDGPIGSKSFSRLGAVESIPEHLDDEWIVIWDDLDRPGDLESFGMALRKLRRLGVQHHHALFDGDRTVGVIYTPGYRGARYFF